MCDSSTHDDIPFDNNDREAREESYDNERQRLIDDLAFLVVRRYQHQQLAEPGDDERNRAADPRLNRVQDI